MKRQRLSIDDHIELSMFKRFLRDRARLPRPKLLRKHQDYLGLTDAELAKLTKP